MMLCIPPAQCTQGAGGYDTEGKIADGIRRNNRKRRKPKSERRVVPMEESLTPRLRLPMKETT